MHSSGLSLLDMMFLGRLLHIDLIMLVSLFVYTSSILTKFYISVEVDECYRIVCCVTQSKVSVNVTEV